MSATISPKDAIKQAALAASGGNVDIIFDDLELPSVMVRVPKFNVEDIHASLGSGVHPAFTINGEVKPFIWIGQHMATIQQSRALSLPGQAPAVVDFQAAFDACKNKGAGWHMMTNAERAALALWSWKNTTMPRGNSDWGRSVDANYEVGVRADGLAPGAATGDGLTLTGSGPKTWRHDHTFQGIADLGGNNTQWITGFRLNDGEINVIQDNNAADNTVDQGAASAVWKGVTSAGNLVAPGTAGTLKYDSVSAGVSGLAGVAHLDDVIDNSNSPGGFTETEFEDLAADAGITVPNILKQLCLFPFTTGQDFGADILNVQNYGEKLAAMSGNRANGTKCGIFSLVAAMLRASTNTSFRVCYYEP